MTHMFKLSRRTARLRAVAAASLLAGLGACDNTESLAPSAAEDTGIAAPSFAVTSTSISISNISVSSGKTYRVGWDLGAGDVMYVDRSYAYAATVPSIAQGLAYIQTANGDKSASAGSSSFLSFDVSKDATIYVGHDNRLARPSWLTSNFQDTGVDLLSSDGLTKFSLYKRSVKAGRVTLGSNTTSSVADASMYVVLVNPASTTTTTTTTTAPTSTTTGAGIAWGDFHLPSSQFTNTSLFSGSLQALWATSGVYETLNAAKSAKHRIIISLAGNRSYYTNSDGTFNLSKWQARVYAFRSYTFGSYVTGGTILGHYLVDEPFCTTCWGGKAIPASTLDEMARYSKSLWPNMPTTVRMPASAMPQQTFQYLDFAWAQWEGSLHWPSFKMTPEQFRDREIAAAQSRGLGLVFGLNYQGGGDGTSHINYGGYAVDPNLSDNVFCNSSGSCYRYEMSAAEVKRVGAVFAAAGYACGVFNWKYGTTFLGRSGMRDAITYVAGIARNRSGASCMR